MRNLGRLLLTIGVIGTLALGAAAGESPSAPHRWASLTIVVANAEDHDSVAIAREYQAARGIPESNLVFLSTSEADSVSRAEFVSTIWNPLRRTLLERGIFEGDSLARTDIVGREQLRLTNARIRYLVLCRGVPFRIREMDQLNDSSLFPKGLATREGAEEDDDPLARIPDQLRKNYASVDSELALLLHESAPLTGFLPNPLFRRMPSPTDAAVVRVTRLDGPTPQSVTRLIRQTLRAEQIGLRGRAYFDLARRRGTYAVGDQWISRAADLAREADFDVTIDEAPALMGTDARFDAPAIYFGWYSSRVGGVFELPGLAFPPGAIAAHLHSSSAARLRNANQGWVGPLIAAGVTATVGNVHEPYLEQTHHFDVLLEALLGGMNFGDAAYAALPSLSWQTVAIGDPLYEPFTVGLDGQLAQAGDLTTAASDSYVVIRRMNRHLRTDADSTAARSIALRALYQTPGLALALKLAELEAEAGDLANARRRLGFASQIEVFAGQDWALFYAAARRLAEWDDPAAAAQVYRHLLADARVPRALRLELLNAGVEAARSAGAYQTAAEWRRQWHALSADM